MNRKLMLFMAKKPMTFALIWLSITLVPAWVFTADFGGV